MQKQKAFTLIELIVVIVLVGLIASMGGMFLTRAFTSANKFAATNDPNYWQGLIAYERMLRDLREMVTLTAASGNSVSYLDNGGNAVTYSLSGSAQLLRSGTVLATGISSLALTYYDANGQTTASLANVRCINIVTVLTQPTQSGSSLQNLVCPRNLSP